MITLDQFIDKLDKMIPLEIQESMQAEMIRMDKEKFSWLDFANLQEKARVLTIKDMISSTHKWSKAHCIDSDGYRQDVFWCPECNFYCSTFEHINKLSIISKVKDNKPTYTFHNQYLMFTCEEIKGLREDSKLHCFDCGMPDTAQTLDCRMVET